MDRGRPALEAEGQPAEVVFDRQGAVARRIDGKARGLVDHDRLAINEQYMVGKHGVKLELRRKVMARTNDMGEANAMGNLRTMMMTICALAGSPAFAEQLCPTATSQPQAD